MKVFLSVLCLMLIAVPAMAADVELNWTAPTTNEDDSPLTDLGGYEACYGSESGEYTTCVDVGNVITYTFVDLVPGTYLFAVKAYDTSGNMSIYSNELRVIIPDLTAIPYHPALNSAKIVA